MKMLSLLLALMMALTPVLSCAEDAPATMTAEEMYQSAFDCIKGENPDFAKAEELCLKAAEQGHAGAMYFIGYYYLTGDLNGGTPDYNKAKEWYLKSAELGDVQAMHYLGHNYLDGYFNEGVPDYDNAVKWYTAAWQNGSTDAMNHLITLYDEGLAGKDGAIIAERDHAKLLQFVEGICAAGGEYDHLYSWLGWFYAGNSDQRVCETDYLRAFEAYKRGAELGNSYCMWQIGLMYEAGRMGAVDLVAAEAWINKAIAAGESDPRVQSDLERIRSLSVAQ